MADETTPPPEKPKKIHRFQIGLNVIVQVAIVIVLLTPSSRFAERYAFSATYAVAALGVVVACRKWPQLREWPVRWAAGTMTAAILWLGLVVLRIALGPWLPRISG